MFMRKLIALFAVLPLFIFAEQTLSFVKPDAFSHAQEIVKIFSDNDLNIVKAKQLQLTQEQAAQFYAIHESRPFFNGLVEYVSSGPIYVMVLEGDNAVEKTRLLVGATDPQKAAPGTIRALFGTSVQQNAIHASDSEASASNEIPFFFPEEKQ